VFPIHDSRITVHGLLFLVLVHDFELRIDDVAAVAFTCALFRATAWLRFRSGLRSWTRTGLR
jgi:hypothetical protein